MAGPLASPLVVHDVPMRLAGIGHRYRRGPWVLRDLDVDLAFGTVVGVSGANGAGKSTLLRIVAGVQRPGRGHIVGRPHRVAYVPERLCIESKSLKFYLAAYRNERAFNEAVTNRILDDFVRAVLPRQASITAQFSARGGILRRATGRGGCVRQDRGALGFCFRD